MVDRPYEILGKYQVGDSIGHGAFGKVYRALNVQTGDFIAIKQIEKAVIQPEHLPGILRECELLQTLNHPNIVTFIDSYETDEYLFYIMEYVEGGSISKLGKKFGPFPESLLAHYISQVLKGLQYLHSQGVIHRDIKGENVLVTKQGTVKLVDFGSCTYQAMDKMLTVVGTPFWMAPEIIEMDGSARNTACDIWSLGCTIIEMSTGFPPFWELGPMPAMFAMVNQDHPPLPSGISEMLQDFLLQCFIKEIQKRPTAAQLLEHPWIASALKKDNDFSLHEPPIPANINHEAIMKQMQMENENLRSTVKSLKQHMLKMMKDQKMLRAKISTLESELASKAKQGNPEASPELRRKTLAPGSIGLSSTPSASLNGSYLATGANASSPPGANISADRLFSPGKPRATSVINKPLPPTPPVPNGTTKPVARLGNVRLNIDANAASGFGHSNGQKSPASQSQASSPRKEDDQLYTRLRSSSEPIPSPFAPEENARVNQALQTGSISSPRNSTVNPHCGCPGCAEDGPCHFRIANITLSPPPPSSPQTRSRAETTAGVSRQINYFTHPTSPHTPQRTHTPSSGHITFASQRNANPHATISTPNLPLHNIYGDPLPRVFSPNSVPPLLSPGTTPPHFSASSSVLPSFSPPSLATLTLRPGDKCRVRSSSNTWHRAIVDELTNNKKSAIVVYKATGKKEEVMLENILTEEEGKRKKLEKEMEKGLNTGKRKHVATIFTNK